MSRPWSRSPRLPVRPEKVEQQHIVTFVRSMGWSAYVIGHPSPNDGRRHRGTGQTSGVADLWLMLGAVRTRDGHEWPPLGLWWEVKRAGGRRSPAQEAFGAQCEAAHQPYGVGTLDDFLAWLIRHGRLRPDQVAHYHLPAEPVGVPGS